MAEYVSCPSCKARLKVPDELIGTDRSVKCPKCARVIRLAEAAARAARPEDDEPPEVVEDEDEVTERPRKSARGRRDGEDDEDRPRRRRRPREDDEEDYDDRPARRGGRKARKKAGSNLALILGLAGGACLLLLIGCGVGAYVLFSGKGGLAALVDNPKVNQANFDRVQIDMALAAVEEIFGPGAAADGGDLKAMLAARGGRMPLEDQLDAVAGNPGAYGITAWYRWKNGPTSMIVGVDGAQKVRVAGLVTATGNSRSSSWKSNLPAAGGGAPLVPRGRK